MDEARAFWSHPSQQLLIVPDDLPDEGFEYWADGPVCGAFHRTFWPDVFMAHYGVKPEGWGRATIPARRILRRFWGVHGPQRIIGWTDSRNRAALAFARRLGFEIDGEMPMKNGAVVMQGWVAK